MPLEERLARLESGITDLAQAIEDNRALASEESNLLTFALGRLIGRLEQRGILSQPDVADIIGRLERLSGASATAMPTRSTMEEYSALLEGLGMAIGEVRTGSET